MDTPPAPPEENRSRPPRGVVGGVILVLIGLMTLISQFVKLPETALFIALGIIFLVWGLITRRTGLIIPGGILTGIFAGATLIEGPYAGLSEQGQGGVFLAAFACGWLLISLLSIYTEGPRKWWSWPLYPGVILGLIAISLFAGEIGQKALEIASYIWPVILIVIGLALVLRRRQ
jgi:hypothetical protein